jgi:hypothetical protein
MMMNGGVGFSGVLDQLRSASRRLIVKEEMQIGNYTYSGCHCDGCGMIEGMGELVLSGLSSKSWTRMARQS